MATVGSLGAAPRAKISVEVENDTPSVTAERERTQEESRDRLYRYERR